jgi:hypothetical protein
MQFIAILIDLGTIPSLSGMTVTQRRIAKLMWRTNSRTWQGLSRVYCLMGRRTSFSWKSKFCRWLGDSGVNCHFLTQISDFHISDDLEHSTVLSGLPSHLSNCRVNRNSVKSTIQSKINLENLTIQSATLLPQKVFCAWPGLVNVVQSKITNFSCIHSANWYWQAGSGKPGLRFFQYTSIHFGMAHCLRETVDVCNAEGCLGWSMLEGIMRDARACRCYWMQNNALRMTLLAGFSSFRLESLISSPSNHRSIIHRICTQKAL